MVVDRIGQLFIRTQAQVKAKYTQPQLNCPPLILPTKLMHKLEKREHVWNGIQNLYDF